VLDDRWVGKRSRSLRTKAADSSVADARQTSISGTEDKRGPGRDEIRSGVAKAATEVAVFGRPPFASAVVPIMPLMNSYSLASIKESLYLVSILLLATKLLSLTFVRYFSDTHIRLRLQLT
jgi:hypothetical protein